MSSSNSATPGLNRPFPVMLAISIIAGAISVFCAFSPVASAQGVEMEPLKIQLPKPMFLGHPNGLPEHCDIISHKPRPAFMAPKGCTNLAKGKEVTSSDSKPSLGNLSMITDGNKEGDEDCVVELCAGLQHVTIDLGQISEIYAIIVWHYHSQCRVYKDQIVRITEDVAFNENVQTVFNNDYNNSSGLGVGQNNQYCETFEGKLIDAKGTKGRYVRLYSNGTYYNDKNHFIEVEVWGKPVAK